MGGHHGFFTGPTSVQANAQAGLPFAEVPEELLEATIEAAEECPGECIFIDV